MTGKNAVTTFLNVDLDIRGEASDIDEILLAMDGILRPAESAVIVLHRMEQFTTVELGESFTSLEETVMGWVDLIDSLPPPIRNIWNALEFRKFNIGIQAECEPRYAEFDVSAKAVASLAAANLEIVFTVYAPSTDAGP